MKNFMTLLSIVCSLSAFATPDDELKFDHSAVIREFKAGGATDGAAMFLILPNRDTLQVRNVTGPAFVGDAHVGNLDEAIMGRLFNHSSQPMGKEERDAIVAKYKGAAVIYFDGYEPEGLCSNKSFTFTMDGWVGTTKTLTNFTFTAAPSATADCTFTTMSSTTTF